MSDKDNKHDTCPICSRDFPLKELQNHANICLFLHAAQESSHDDKPPKKRPRSPESISSNKSPRNTSTQTSKGTSPSSQKSLHPFFSQVARPSTSNEKSPRLTQNNHHEFHKPQTSTKTKEDPMAFLTPLAKQVAPKSFQDFFGQNHVLGEKTVLRSLIDKGEVPNMILWGPPGCGKTSLAGVVQEKCKSNPALYKFHSLCAATCGVKEVSTIVANAKNERKFGRRTVLFMDEIHRFNKKQQDVFLLHVERGDIVLIGATTENPSFVMNSALLSRCRVIVMEKLDPGDVLRIVVKAARNLNVKVLKDKETSENENNKETSENEKSENEESENEEESDEDSLIESLGIEKSALKWLADTSDGDARIALGNLQLVLQHNKNHEGLITFDDIKEGVKKSHLLYDRQGEEHYNIISAMHKSIRGSDVNASLYWTTRMIVSGEDPRFIARRLVRAASEDIGNADPNALQLAISTMQGCQLLGMPEADVLLAQCAIYLARAPKSREADSALASAKKTISNCEGLQPSVPLHLRNAPTKLMKDLGYGKQDANNSSSFMPPGMENVNFFQ